MLTTYKSIRFFTTALALIAAQTGVFAQAAAAAAAPAAEPAKQSVYTSPVFYALALVALVLLIFIIQLGKVVSAVAKNYQRGDGSAWDKMKMVVAIITATMFFSHDASAQAANAASQAAATVPDQSPVLDFLHQGFGYNAINALVVVILVELFVVVYLVRMIRLFIVKEAELSPLKEHAESTSVFWDKFNASVAIEKEAAVLTDHDYDGIRELDNALPPWWKYGFYFTIVWAMVYLVYFHISNGPSSAEEYKAQMDAGAAQVAAYQAKAKDLVTEKTVTLLTDASDIDAGKAAFVQYCAVCHGPDGGGIVGPNLTDKFWLHGGDVKDVFTTIKYGVQGKGMKSWQQELSPKMIAQVSSFVLSLQGTTPANPKAPEGTEFVQGAAATDTTQTTVVDTTQTGASDTLVTDGTKMSK